MTDSSLLSPKKITKPKRSSLMPKDDSDLLQFSEKELPSLIDSFSQVIEMVAKEKTRLEDLQKEITEVKEGWKKAQKERETALINQEKEDELQRQRDQKTYEYETLLARKKAEDEFKARLELWEKELKERKDELSADKENLNNLQKQVEGFETQKEKAVKEALAVQLKELTSKYDQQKILTDQQQAAEKQMAAVKNDSLLQENARLGKEIEALKKSLEEAQRQLKEIAVKVIEAGGSGAVISNKP